MVAAQASSGPDVASSTEFAATLALSIPGERVRDLSGLLDAVSRRSRGHGNCHDQGVSLSAANGCYGQMGLTNAASDGGGMW